MSDDFDLAHDKLPDQPPTIIGGDKSAAAWHPNSGPKAQHADLIARLREEDHAWRTEVGEFPILREAADALAALGDTVPREQHERHLAANRYPMAQLREARAERDALQRGVVAATERAEAAEAERDALAHVIEQAKAVTSEMADTDEYPLEFYWRARILRHLDITPAASLALHDAEVWDEGVRAKSASSSIFDADVLAANPYRTTALTAGEFYGDRAAAIREEAN